tara:strand:- start:579 stop:1088 length:510 start_codon:yes stop_codon:yes gene_type:complete
MKKGKKLVPNFKIGDMVVYPSHGVGQIVSIVTMEINKIKMDFFSIQMEQDNLMLQVPFAKVNEVNLRKLASKKVMQEALSLLKNKVKYRRMMWSRRAQEYTGKINSGSPLMISEVVRDLYRKNSEPEQSYSERQMFQSAISRLARELAAVEKIDHFTATEKIETILQNK